MPNATRKRKKSQKRARGTRGLVVVLGSLVLMLALLTGMSAQWFGKSDALAPQKSTIDDDGLLRVYLKSLNQPRALGLTLDGAYTVEGDAGFRFARGSEISVAADGDALLLTAGGLTINMGASFTLTRQAPSDNNISNGLYIHESERDALFMGDLLLKRAGEGIDAILTVQVEDYLYGVVAYEMSDSFPLEALKAQAVAARTYAMNAKWRSGKRAYDVVDTTADQVYKGYEPIFSRVAQAVDETRGIVGMVNGAFAGCYYTASNGGQVASAKQIWGGDGAEYIEMKDDPYDLENPQSVVKRASIPYTPEAGGALARALAEAISEEMATMGYSDDAADIRIDRISAIAPADPDIQGSRMCASMLFTLRVSGRQWTEPAARATPEEATPENAAPIMATQSEATPEEATPEEAAQAIPVLSDFTPVEKEITAKLATYGLLEDMYSLSINSTDIEIFTAEETQDGFTICARRFGHGVGMSQRGAQTMAGSYEKTCEEILAFYYPGMTLYEIDWNVKPLDPIEALPESVGLARAKPTPKPTQAPLPALTGDEYYAVVALETASSTLNVRQEPNTSARIMGTLSKGDRVIVLAAEADNWFKIKTAELNGYVKGDYITRE